LNGEIKEEVFAEVKFHHVRSLSRNSDDPYIVFRLFPTGLEKVV